jgi:hypothetical protein
VGWAVVCTTRRPEPEGHTNVGITRDFCAVYATKELARLRCKHSPVSHLYGEDSNPNWGGVIASESAGTACELFSIKVHRSVCR